MASLAHSTREESGTFIGWQIAALLLLAAASALAQSHKRNEEPKPQVLPLPKEPPVALAADVDTLSFRVSPLLRTGKLSAQIRDTLNEIIRDAHGASIVKLRAFVSGAGDTRRVQALMSDLFTEHKLSLPVLVIVQVGALGDDASQVVIESVVSERRAQNPQGLAFLASQRAESLPASIAKLQQSLKAAQLPAAEVVSVTCLLDSLADYHHLMVEVWAAFPKASLNVVQSQRQAGSGMASCEAVARVTEAVSSNVFPHSRVTVLTARQKAVFTGLQLGFGPYLDDATAALARLRRNAESASADFREAAIVNVYSLSPEASSALRKTALKFAVPAEALSFQPVEGLPSLDAALGVEAIFGGPVSTDAAAPGH